MVLLRRPVLPGPGPDVAWVLGSVVDLETVENEHGLEVWLPGSWTQLLLLRASGGEIRAHGVDGHLVLKYLATTFILVAAKNCFLGSG